MRRAFCWRIGGFGLRRGPGILLMGGGGGMGFGWTDGVLEGTEVCENLCYLEG